MTAFLVPHTGGIGTGTREFPVPRERARNTEHKENPSMTTTTTVPVKALRASFHQAILRHGGRRTGNHYTVPVGAPVNGRQPWLRMQVVPTGYGRNNCTITMDRWNASDAPEAGEEWLKENIWPFTRRATENLGSYFLSLAGVGSYTSAVVRRADVAEVLDAWLPQEEKWQRGKGRHER